MSWFGLDPDSRLARDGAELPAPFSCANSALRGAVAFGTVSTVAYGIWAFGLLPYGLGMYAAIAVVYLGLGGLALAGLVAGRGVFPRVTALFAAAFLAYAVVWCLFWFGLRGKHHADLWGAAVGLALMTLIIRRVFGANGSGLAAWAVLFAYHTLGYTLGDELHAAVRGPVGRLLWGAAHGVGFGAGLGWLLAAVQRRERAQT
jgi:hypothetical protein